MLSLSKKTKKISKSLDLNFSSALGQEIYDIIAKKGFRDQEEPVCKKYLKKDKKILDLGCGSGRLTIALSNCGYKDVTGVDILPKMIELAKKATQNKNITYFRGDATNLQFDNKSFDAVVFTHNGWSQIPGEKNRIKAICEINRVLKKEGIYIFSFFVWRFSLFSIWKWIKYYIAKIFHIPIWELEFGDTILYSYEDYLNKGWCKHIPRFFHKSKEMKLFIHYYESLKKATYLLNNSNFDILEIIEEHKLRDVRQFRIIAKKS